MRNRISTFLLALVVALFVGAGVAPAAASATDSNGDGFSTEWGGRPADQPVFSPQP